MSRHYRAFSLALAAALEIVRLQVSYDAAIDGLWFDVSGAWRRMFDAVSS
jgi:hypothetical protein